MFSKQEALFLFWVPVLIINLLNYTECSSSEEIDQMKWMPIRNYKPISKNPSEPMSVLESISKPTQAIASLAESRDSNANENNSVSGRQSTSHQQISACGHSLSTRQLLELLRGKQQDSQQPAASFLAPINVANQFIQGSKGLIDSINNLDDDYNGDDDNENDEPITDSNGRQRISGRNEPTTVANQQPLDRQQSASDSDGNQDLADDQLRREQEANESSEAELVDKSALDEQQQQQKEIIKAQAESEAMAIKEQQESLAKQQKLQQQMLFMRDRLSGADLSSNNSDSYSINSLVDRRKLHKKSIDDDNNLSQHQSRANLPESDVVQFSDSHGRDEMLSLLSDNSDHRMIKKSAALDEYEKESIASDTNKQQQLNLISTNSDLLPASQHHYGSHFGSLHGHQSHNYQ